MDGQRSTPPPPYPPVYTTLFLPQESASLVMALPDGSPLDAFASAAIAALWADATVQAVYAQRARFQLIDSAAQCVGWGGMGGWGDEKRRAWRAVAFQP